MNNNFVREARLDDLESGLLQAFIDGYRYHQNGRPDVFSNITDESLKGKLLKDLDKFNILVALKDDEIVGYLAYEIKEKDYAKMHIDQLAVRSEFRGQGFGGLLIEAAKEKAIECNCRRIELDCWIFNESALNFYTNLGFENQRIMYEMKLKK